jgi:hypothetical protein
LQVIEQALSEQLAAPLVDEHLVSQPSSTFPLQSPYPGEHFTVQVLFAHVGVPPAVLHFTQQKAQFLTSAETSVSQPLVVSLSQLAQFELQV